MREVLEIVLSFALTTAALFAIVLRDERRLSHSPELLERAWPAPSRSAALIVFGVLALPVHYARTRRSLAGFFTGLGLASLVSVVNGLVLTAVDWLLGG